MIVLRKRITLLLCKKKRCFVLVLSAQNVSSISIVKGGKRTRTKKNRHMGRDTGNFLDDSPSRDGAKISRIRNPSSVE